MEFQHTSVLLQEVIDGLAVKPDGIYVDGTLGGAGHGSVVCSMLGDKGRFIGIDCSVRFWLHFTEILYAGYK